MWPASIMLGESYRNLVSRIVLNSALLLSLIGSMASVMQAELVETDRAIRLDTDQRARGSNILVVAALDPRAPGVSQEVCASLNRLPQIVAAGGLTAGGPVEVAQSPQTPFRLFRGTDEIVRVLDPGSSGATAPNLWIAKQASQQLGVTNGVRVDLLGAERVAQIFDPGLRLPGGDLMLVQTGLWPTVDQCWFEVVPGTVSYGPTLARSMFAIEEDPITVTSVLDDPPNPLVQFRNRSTRLLWIGAAGFGWLAAGMMALSTRRENALYRVLGSGRLGATIIGLVEFALVGVLATLAATSITLMRHSDAAPASQLWALWVAGSVYALTLVGAGIVFGLVSLGNAAVQLKDRTG